MNLSRFAFAILSLLIVVNILDIIVHIAVNQPELLRILSNIVISLSAFIPLLNNKFSKRSMLMIGLGAYLLLNGIFIINNNGIGNAGILFILTTSVLTILLNRNTKGNSPFRTSNNYVDFLSSNNSLAMGIKSCIIPYGPKPAMAWSIITRKGASLAL